VVVQVIRNFSLAALFILSFSACVTPYQNPNLPGLAPESQYTSAVDKYTAKQKVYDGFNQTMEISGTLLNTEVTRSQLDHKARIYQWSPEEYSSHKAESESDLSKRTTVFLSFFVPERKHDDLHKPKTLWKIFLDAGGRRFEGKAEKQKTILADVTSLYPNHTRFSTPYHIHFPVPVTMIENTESKLTITGPVGTATLTFPPAQ
jgi:hypothetical protein